MKILVCNRERFWLRLYNDDRLVREYPVAVGQRDYPTPEGAYKIVWHKKNPSWWLPSQSWVPRERWGDVVPPGPDNPIKSRWLGIVDGVGIHGTDVEWSIGTAASHGCIRMLIPDVEDLFDRVPVGTPIAIL